MSAPVQFSVNGQGVSVAAPAVKRLADVLRDDLGLTEDKWVRASEVAADKKQALHHIITTMIPPDGAAD